MGSNCYQRYLKRAFQQFPKRAWSSLIVIMFALHSGSAWALPEELYRGMIKFDLESENFLNALVLMDDDFKKKDLVAYVSALKGFSLNKDVISLLEVIASEESESVDQDYFNVGKVEYFSERCIPALKAFKRLKNKLTIEEKDQWSYYRANCFIKLGSNIKAAQVLNEAVGGLWASYAYYNLAMSYAESSSNKSKAIVVLRIAESLNPGKSKQEKELNDRINFAAGALYLEGGKPDEATSFFKKIFLDSEVAPQALYLNGVAQLELNDFRAATQSWFKVKIHPLIHSGVSEAMLAIPYAYERSGYVSQALEAYIEATKSFEQEIETIDKITDLLNKHGAKKVLIDGEEIAGLEWFLAKDIAKNTRRAAYYSHLMSDEAFYDTVKLLFEIKMLQDSLGFWNDQLGVFDKLISTKKKNFNKQSKSFNPQLTQQQITGYAQQLAQLKSEPQLSAKMSEELQLDAVALGVDALQARVNGLEGKIAQGGVRLDSQLTNSIKLDKKIKTAQKLVSKLLTDLDAHITGMALERLDLLKDQMTFNFEQSEQGLANIFEGMAENDQPRRNLLDGRYQ